MPKHPGPFDMWEFTYGTKRHALKPKLRRICRHGKQQVYCSWEDCRAEALDIICPPKPVEPQPRTFDDLIQEEHAKRSIAIVRNKLSRNL